ncbi:hypothetical protein PUN28_013079 [Cardiocondyla obscurior]|uniref:MoaB/Mog domain-containing protein n=1 Tax=Cardiocondyla obscurior TaxID=286306 RepID=A0AAW2F9B7_9HYME
MYIYEFLVIGDEILKAQVRDTNSYYISNLLYKCGIQVKKISVISDDVEEISKEIQDASKKYTYVITSGGIGPTHDDLTYEGLAKAFNDELHYHPKLVDIIKNHFEISDDSSPVYKMAQIPQKASLKFGLNTYPYITLENVHVFPGSPAFLKKSFQSLYEDLLKTNKKFVKEEVFIDAREDLFANSLSTVAKEFPNVSFGSYPVNNCRYFKAFVTVESDNNDDVKKAKQRFYELNPTNIFVNFDRTPQIDCIKKYNNFLQNCSNPSIYEQSLEKLRELYQNPERVSICIDGTIESSIVIHLAHICKTQLHFDDKLQVRFFKTKELPIEMEEFTKEMIDKYNLTMHTVETVTENKTDKKTTRSDLRSILLIGKVQGNGENKIDTNYNDMDNINQLIIDNPLDNWTKKDIWVFTSSLCIPYNFAA